VSGDYGVVVVVHQHQAGGAVRDKEPSLLVEQEAVLLQERLGAYELVVVGWVGEVVLGEVRETLLVKGECGSGEGGEVKGVFGLDLARRSGVGLLVKDGIVAA
jgi:hypothetical protein